MMRVCKKCGIEKELTEFVSEKGCTHGRTWECKECRYTRLYDRSIRIRPLEERPQHQTKVLLAQGLKKCFGCKEIKPVSDFWQSARWANNICPRCKACNKTANANWRNNNVERRAQYFKEYDARPESKEIDRAGRRRRAANSPRHVLQITLAHGLKRRLTENPATINDLMEMFTAQDGKCSVTGITMTWAQGRVLPTSISLDRIDSNGGYSRDNLRLICHAVNAFKGRMTDAEMLIMAKAIVTNLEEKSSEPTWRPHLVHSEAA